MTITRCLLIAVFMVPALSAQTHNTWTGARTGDSVLLRIMPDAERYHSSKRLPLTALEGLNVIPKNGTINANFILQREAGTFHFEGRFEKGFGSGTYRFEPAPTFLDALQQAGYTIPSDRKLQTMALVNLNASFISDILALDYPRPAIDILLGLRIHDVDLAYFDNLAAANLFPDSLEQAMAFRIHNISPDYLKTIRKSFPNLAGDQLLAFRIHDIDGQVLAEWASAGYDQLDSDHIIAFKVHGVTSDYIAAIHELGLQAIPAEQLIAFRVHNISPDQVAELQLAGLQDLTPERIIAFAVHGVDRRFIDDMAAVGYDQLSAEDLIAFRVHGVSLDYMDTMIQAGVEAVTPSQWIAFRVHNVSPKTVQAVQKRGIRPSAENLIKAEVKGLDWERAYD